MIDDTMKSIQDSEEAYVHFPSIDMNSHLKLETYIELCLPKNFAMLEKHFDLFSLRKQGLWPIAYYVNIQNHPQAVGFGNPLFLQHQALLRRHTKEPPQKDKKTERLFYDLSTHVSAHESIGSAENLGMGTPSESIVPVGNIQMLQIFTKPLAPPDQRRVTEVPPALQKFQETPWHEPFPSHESLQAFPKEFQSVETAPAFHSVWGLSNTDLNQHVTMTEYMTGLQNHATRLLFQAEKPVTQHFVHQAQFIFRKPFFPGQCYAIQGKLGFCEEKTIFLGGIYLAEPDGTRAATPSIFSRMEGSFCLKNRPKPLIA